MNFGITLSDDGTQMDIYVDFYRNGEIALFTLPVSAYLQFCDFAYAAYQYVQEKILTYSLPEKEAAELKTFQTEILQYCIWKSTEYRKADKNGGIQVYSFSNAQGQPADKSPLGKLHHSLNPNAPEDTVYSFDLNMEYSYRGTSSDGKAEDIIVPEKPRCVSYDFHIENTDEKTVDVWRSFRIAFDVVLKDNNTELELCLRVDEWEEQNNQKYYTSYTVPFAQYTLLPAFICALYEYWSFNKQTYYKIIEKKQEENGITHMWKERHPRKKEIAKVFIETAQHMFNTEPKGEVLTVDAHVFKERMEALEYPDWDIASSYSEIIEVNGIRQIILSTGIDVVHIQLAVTLNDSLTELEVYLDEKTEPAEQPLFVLNSSDYALLATFFAELKAHQVEDMRACKKKFDAHRVQL